ncbi:MAG: 1-acyl-sn-glycerol-3-phosphate acyltransferase [Burkholderiaceae bacterium]|jgi:1-acyl-sn-glycerol-3-phosphate acyltransferase|nr:1-acyl-sn-glycerol-3-phosphate acyltransferase [Burkholderiaceae bacterium]
MKREPGIGSAMMQIRLARWLDPAWRTIATGISFAVFGMGGLLLRVLIFPPLQRCVRDPLRQRRIARRWVQRSFAVFIELMRRLGVLTWEVHHRERLQREGLLVLANHPTLLDVVFLVSLLPHTNCVVKSAAARNLFFRGPVRACGYIANDSRTGLIDDCIAAVRAGDNLIVFPEGTRSVPEQPLRLQRGAARIAVRGALNMTPVRIRCTPPTLTKGEKWYRVPRQRFHIRIEVAEDLPIGHFFDPENTAPESLIARQLTEYLTDYFSGDKPHAGFGTGDQGAHHLFAGARWRRAR